MTLSDHIAQRRDRIGNHQIGDDDLSSADFRSDGFKRVSPTPGQNQANAIARKLLSACPANTGGSASNQECCVEELQAVAWIRCVGEGGKA